MRWVSAGLLGLLLFSCVTPTQAPVPSLPPLWRPPPKPEQPALLRIEPRLSAARLGESATLRVVGELAGGVQCRGPAGPISGPELQVSGPPQPAVVNVSCASAAVSAEAQVTFTDSATLPVDDPYGGGVALFKLRDDPAVPLDPVGRRELGFPALDAKLQALNAWALPAFPFDREGMPDRIGLDRWLVIDLRMEVNFYQAMALLRSDPAIHPESYLPQDASFLRVRERGGWPVALEKPRRYVAGDPEEELLLISDEGAFLPESVRPGWELEAIGAPEAWQQVRGRGVGIAVVDTGVDVNHSAVERNIRTKQDEQGRGDADGNGIPGDQRGINLAHLAISHGYGPPRLALGLLWNFSDWDGVHQGRDSRHWGHGTAIAALAAGTGVAGERPGVAPQAWILPVDTQENLRTSSSQIFDEDRRMRDLPASRPARRAMAPLRELVWARAAGIVYAATEGARVVTCAWPALGAHWILHDALLFAEDSCVVPVCAIEAGSSSDEPVFPAGWRAGWLASRGAGSGAVLDLWTGETTEDWFTRTLRALLIADDPAAHAAGTHEPDLWGPGASGQAHPGFSSAVSNPRNDVSPVPDRRRNEFRGPGMAAGLLAGAVALLVEQRPDLEPYQLREALLTGAEQVEGRPSLRLGPALEAASAQPRGSCDAPRRRLPDRDEARSLWDRVKSVKIKMGGPGGTVFDSTKPSDPNEPEEADPRR